MYREHVAAHDEAVLKQLGGGGIHFCGKGEHLVPEILKLPSLTALDLGQPQKNDLDKIYRLAAVRKIPIVRLRLPEQDLLSGDAVRRFPTGVSLFHAADSLGDASRIMAALRSAKTMDSP